MPAVLVVLLVVLLTLSPMLRPGAARDFLAYWTYASGRSSTSSFVRLGLGGTVEMFERANALPGDARILAIAEARRYYFRRPITLSSVFDFSPIGSAIGAAREGSSIRDQLLSRGYTHLLVNEYEMARLLDFHPPPILLEDAEFMELREGGRSNYAVLAERYQGYGEFGTQALGARERRIYLEFLQSMREEAVFFPHERAGYPALWIAEL
ncbi:hypothetical protein IIC65_05340 [Candidatus Sumerlaeota bacterium]|nr:hypothetical protein [Candidatus Sumerlaeota bacterium]